MAEESLDKAFKVVNSPGEGDKKTLLETVKDLERIIEAGKGKKSECIAGIGRCLFRLGELDQAREKLEEAINMRDSGPFWRTWINLRLGCIADLQKKRSEAEAFYRKAMEVRNGSQHAILLAERFLEKPYRGYQKDG